MRWALFFGFLTFLSIVRSAEATDSCAPDRIDQVAIVRSNHDGDTLTLQNGQKIRIIGLDTPELAQASKKGHKAKSHQPFALEAKQLTWQLLSKSKQHIKLRFDTERYDRHGRLLAHVFTADNSNLAAQLIAKGMATQFVMPPNLLFFNCYQQNERTAQTQGLGIWQLKSHQVHKASRLGLKTSAFRILQGYVDRVQIKNRSVFIYLQENIVIRIDQKERGYFKSLNFHNLVGQHITVRGRLHNKASHFYMRLYHPYALQLSNNSLADKP